MEPLIFHVDVNSAYLSWEAARRVANGEPDIRLIPSAIGGDRQTRTGVILAKSIAAKNIRCKQENRLPWRCANVLSFILPNRTFVCMNKTPELL